MTKNAESVATGARSEIRPRANYTHAAAATTAGGRAVACILPGREAWIHVREAIIRALRQETARFPARAGIFSVRGHDIACFPARAQLFYVSRQESGHFSAPMQGFLRNCRPLNVEEVISRPSAGALWAAPAAVRE